MNITDSLRAAGLKQVALAITPDARLSDACFHLSLKEHGK